MAATVGSIIFVIVVVGGMGSLTGAFIASLAIGLLQTFAVAVDVSLQDLMLRVGVQAFPGTFAADLGRITLAQAAPALPYLLMVLVLILRPSGLLGTRTD